MNGIAITREEFERMKTTDKFLVVFDNLEYIRTYVTTMRFHRKIHYSWLCAITLAVGGLLGIKLL